MLGTMVCFKQEVPGIVNTCQETGFRASPRKMLEMTVQPENGACWGSPPSLRAGGAGRKPSGEDGAMHSMLEMTHAESWT